MAAGVKHIWTDEEISSLKANWATMTNRQLADHVGITLTLVRSKCYELGLLRMEMEYWTNQQIKFLIKNYKKFGDSELADLFNKKWKKNKGWTKKHIEKKRRYLKLKRTDEEKQKIHKRNVKRGCFSLCPVKAWKLRGVSKEGTIRMWRTYNGRLVPFIKVEGKYVHWSRWRWTQLHGKPPKGYNAVFKDNNPYNREDDNLELITDGELARRNSLVSSQGLSDNYVAGILTHGDKESRELVKKQPALIKMKREQLKLNRIIHEQETTTAA